MRVALADDSVLLREGIARMLTDAGLEVVARAGDATALVAALERTPVDVAIVDIRMPPTHTTEGLVAALAIRAAHPRTGVLILSQHLETHYALQLLEGGTERIGYLLKDRVVEIGELVDAVRRVAAGGSVIDPLVISRLVGRRRERDPLADLTDREREVLALMAEGRSNQAISDRLFVSPKTVETHIRSIFSKLGLEDAPADNRRVLSVLTHLRG
jgi:DNA-binding NarL/FixJ family response regulator